MANQLDFTTTHQYLGVWLESHLFTMGAIKSMCWGFIPRIVGFLPPCHRNCNRLQCTIPMLVGAENDALRVIIDPYNWCQLANPRTESSLPSLHHRIFARTESIATKLIRTRPELSVSPNWFRHYDSHITM